MSSDIIGVPVMVHDACLNCGGNACFVDRGPAPLYRQLLCDGCECGRGYVSRELRTFLEKFVQQFGRHRPIILRSGKLHKPGGVGGHAVIATEPKPKRRTKVGRRTFKANRGLLLSITSRTKISKMMA
jgi:hypothetical protein